MPCCSVLVRYTRDRVELRLENVDRVKAVVLELLVARLEYRMYATEPNYLIKTPSLHNLEVSLHTPSRICWQILINR